MLYKLYKKVTKVVTSPISTFSGKISFFQTSLLLRSEWRFGLLEQDLDRDRFLNEKKSYDSCILTQVVPKLASSVSYQSTLVTKTL